MTQIEIVAATFVVGVVLNIAAPTVRMLGGSESAANRTEGFARMYNALVMVYFVPHPLVGAVAADEANAGFQQILTGKHAQTYVAQGATALGASPFVAEVTSSTVQVVVSLPALLTEANRMMSAIRLARTETEIADSLVPAEQKLLDFSGTLADHHVFPRQFEGFFNAHGINIDEFTVSVDHVTTHLKGIHGSGNMGQMPGGWNRIWAEWIKNNPNATALEIYQQAGKMMDQFGIGHLKIHYYRH